MKHNIDIIVQNINNGETFLGIEFGSTRIIRKTEHVLSRCATVEKIKE